MSYKNVPDNFNTSSSMPYTSHANSYLPVKSDTDWGITRYQDLIMMSNLNGGDPLDVVQGAARTYQEIGHTISGSNAGSASNIVQNVTVAVGKVQSPKDDPRSAWTGGAAAAYYTHVNRVTDFGTKLGAAIGVDGTNSLAGAAKAAADALVLARNQVRNVSPATWQEAYDMYVGPGTPTMFPWPQTGTVNPVNGSFAGTQMPGQLGTFGQRLAAIRASGPTQSGVLIDDLNSLAETIRESMGPDNFVSDYALGDVKSIKTPFNGNMDQVATTMWQMGDLVNQYRANVVGQQLTALGATYLHIANNQIPAAPAPVATSKNNSTGNPGPNRPTAPASTTTQQNAPKQNTPTTPTTSHPTATHTPPTGSTTAPTTPAGMTAPTSTTGIPSNSPLAGTTFPAPVGPVGAGAGGGIAPTFNPNLDHMTMPAGFGVPPGGPGGVGMRTPKALGGLGADGLGAGHAGGGAGAGGDLGSALPDAAALDAAGAANTAGRGGMPAGGAGAGGKGAGKERNRGVHLPEDEDVWGVRDSVSPPVIGGSW